MLLDAQASPVAETSLSHYFMNRLTHHARRLSPPPAEDVCWYLGSVLDRFGRSDRFFSWQDGQLTLRPLALLYSDALEATNERERCLLLQQLGDMALFIGALFPDRYARHGIGQDYFVGMGGGAYDYLADNARRNRHIFAELSRRFARILDLVAGACARTEELSNEDVLVLYQRWAETRDPAAGRVLRSLGIRLDEGERVH
ncbi:MAG: hypothetical protein AB7I04_16510 [Pseudomonadales bacterium]